MHSRLFESPPYLSLNSAQPIASRRFSCVVFQCYGLSPLFGQQSIQEGEPWRLDRISKTTETKMFRSGLALIDSKRSRRESRSHRAPTLIGISSECLMPLTCFHALRQRTILRKTDLTSSSPAITQTLFFLTYDFGRTMAHHRSVALGPVTQRQNFLTLMTSN